MLKDINHEQQYAHPKASTVQQARRYSVLLLLAGLLLAGLTPAANARHIQLKPGDILVADRDANPRADPSTGNCGECRGVLFRVDPTTGERQIVTNFNNPRQGRLGSTPLGVAIEATGKILVTDGGGPGTRCVPPDPLDPEALCLNGALFRVDPVTHRRALINEFGFQQESRNPGDFIGKEPNGIAIKANGQIFVVDETAQGLFRVDPVSQLRTKAINLTENDPKAGRPQFVAIAPTGVILISDQGGQPGGYRMYLV